MGIFQTWTKLKAWMIQTEHDMHAEAEATRRNSRRLKNIEDVLTSAGLADFHLYRIPGESAVDVAELEAMVHMLADHLGLEWMTVPETSSWEERAEPIIMHARGMLLHLSDMLDADGVQHPAVDAALVELSKLGGCSCST